MKELIGKTIRSIRLVRPMYSNNPTEIYFQCADGTMYNMYHVQDCCENVSLEETIGDFNDLLNTPVLQAEATTSQDNAPSDRSIESFTWTFYTISTIKGTVTLRWLGESNGYYSEEVSFQQVTKLPEYLKDYNSEIIG